ncbi:mitogen-activated protein kinase kinase 1 interacting domain protein [Nitzschia inconspicua]|uniref:Mitogen-activated protein kinase kinase 1 interacting domain protein n=1 Tax=Nitzschia inconspicua TaxID=303405 RepID=A0A9K3LP90_9STRA|nr:mitogen-activated protein kinase kinase 1 interacting domain protein [Nitzschia inconspicua]
MSSTVDLLPANLQNSLNEIIEWSNFSGAEIRVILLSTAEGVPLGRAYSKEDRNNPNLNEDVLSNIESTWAPASKQFPLLNMGKEIKMVTAIYDQRTIIHVYQAPIVVTILVGGATANLGAVRSTAVPLLKQVLEPLCTTLLDSLAPVDSSDAGPAGVIPYQQHGYYQ